MTLYFTFHIYKHILGLPESFTESLSTSISLGASDVNLENLTMTQLSGWQLEPRDQYLHFFLENLCTNLWKLLMRKSKSLYIEAFYTNLSESDIGNLFVDHFHRFE